MIMTISAGRPSSWRPLAVLLVAAFLLAFFAVWTGNLGVATFSGDESFVAKMVEHPAAEILRRLNADEPHPPLYYLLARAWRVAAGFHQEYFTRYPSALISLLVLSLAYRLARQLNLGLAGALSTMLLLGLDPQASAHFREARMYGLMMLGFALALLAAVRFRQTSGPAAIALSVVANLAALLSHYFNVFFIAALGVWGLATQVGPFHRRWAWAQVITWGVFGVWLPLMGRGFFNSASLSEGKTWSFTLPPWEHLARLADTAVFGYRALPGGWLAWLGGAALAGAWLFGSLQLTGSRRWLLLACLALPLLTYTFIGWFKPLYHPKYVLPWIMLAALAAGALVRFRPWAGIPVWIVLIALMARPWWHTMEKAYDPAFATPYEDWLGPEPRDLSHDLQQLFGPDDVFALGTPDEPHCYYAQYYFARDLGCALIPEYPTQSLEELTNHLRTLLDGHGVVWLQTYYNPAWDPNHLADAALSATALDLGHERVAERDLRLFTSAGSVLRGQQAVNAEFSKLVRLDGIWLQLGATNVHLVLVWRSLADHPNLDLKVFVHLVGESGAIVAQDDSLPVQWTRPVNTWATGEQLLDVHTLPLPSEAAPQDSWALQIGLYDATTSVRLGGQDSSGNTLVDDAVVVPLANWLKP